ncbi:hypothetical protein FKM82_023198 [Ascaphus truei]
MIPFLIQSLMKWFQKSLARTLKKPIAYGVMPHFGLTQLDKLENLLNNMFLPWLTFFQT